MIKLLLLFSFYSHANYFLLNKDLTIIRYSADPTISELIPRYLVQRKINSKFEVYWPDIIFGVTKAVLSKSGEVVGYHTDDKRYQIYLRNKCKKAVEE